MASAEKIKKVPLYKQRTTLKEGFKEMKKILKGGIKIADDKGIHKSPTKKKK